MKKLLTVTVALAVAVPAYAQGYMYRGANGYPVAVSPFCVNTPNPAACSLQMQADQARRERDDKNQQAIVRSAPPAPEPSDRMYTANAMYGDGVYICGDSPTAYAVMKSQNQYHYAQMVMRSMNAENAEYQRLHGYGAKPVPPEDYGCAFVPNGTKVKLHSPTQGVDVDLPNGEHYYGVIPVSELHPL